MTSERIKALLANRWGKIGLGLVLIGWSPLLAVILLDAVGLWPDPNPNPVGFGMLFGLTFWPAIGCRVAGYVQTRNSKNWRTFSRVTMAPLMAIPNPVAGRRGAISL